jgi:hypothetical protein
VYYKEHIPSGVTRYFADYFNIPHMILSSDLNNVKHVMKKMHNEKRGNRMHILGSLHFYMVNRKSSATVHFWTHVDRNFFA